MIRMSNEAADPVLQRSLEIRKSVESAVLDLEQEVIRYFNPSVHFSLLILTELLIQCTYDVQEAKQGEKQ